MSSVDLESEGVCLVSNNFKKQKPSKKTIRRISLKTGLHDCAWFNTFEENWSDIENEIEELFTASYKELHDDIVNHLKWDCCQKTFISAGMVPIISVISGTNSADYTQHQFHYLLKKVKKDVTKHTIIINARDIVTKKHLLEKCFQGFIYKGSLEKNSVTENTMDSLKSWYSGLYNKSHCKRGITPNSLLVIIMPDFESFDCNILLDFIMILSHYSESLPIVLICGASTCLSIQKIFPFHVTSKMMIKMFQLNSMTCYTQKLLEEIFLSYKRPFHVSGQAFAFLIDLFASYNLSVQRLMYDIKFIMMEHYYNSNIKILCCTKENTQKAVTFLSDDDLRYIKSLNSFRNYVEPLPELEVLKILKSNDYFRSRLKTELLKFHEYKFSFFICLKMLLSLTKSLPGNKLGKSLSEIYIKCTSEDVTKSKDFKNIMQLLRFQSKTKLVDSIKKCLKILREDIATNDSAFSPMESDSRSDFGEELGSTFLATADLKLRFYLKKLENNTESHERGQSSQSKSGSISSHSRLQLKENLLKSTIDTNQSQSENETQHLKLVQFLEEMFKKALKPPLTRVFHEIFFFDDATNVEEHIVGLHRGSIHKNLCEPEPFTKLCGIDGVPDICIAYKLYLEYGRHINMDDWLVAFDALLRPSSDDDNVPPEIVRRFKRVVGGMRHAGLIRLSRESSTHATRLTFC